MTTATSMANPADSATPATGGSAPVAPPTPARWRRAAYHAFFRALTAAHNALMRLGKALGPRKRAVPRDGGWEILLTGRFESANWLRAHLAPLAQSRLCRRLRVVSTYPVPAMPKVEAVAPPTWLVRWAGQTPARLAQFVWTALTSRPDFVGGFHLLVNGLVATALAPWAGARSMYFCVGGPVEFAGGGVWCADGNPFEKMVTPDAHVERRLLRALDACDLVVTMGERARAAIGQAGVRTRVEVVSGGLDGRQFAPAERAAEFDVVLTGRLAPVKRIDIFLEALALADREAGPLTAVIVGDGPLRESLQEHARRLGLGGRVRFVGFQDDVGRWLHKARLFVLTSDSEGLALSLMEAMMSGLPAVVSDVGELSTLVNDGENGHLVERRDVQGFARRIGELLSDETCRQTLAAQAAKAARRFTVEATARRWDDILAPDLSR